MKDLAVCRLKFVVVLSTITVLFLVGLYLYLPTVVRDSRIYVAASIDKENRLNSLPGKRIILVGGSNLAFGIDSRKLSMKCGRPVVNMGLHGALGLPFILSETKAGVMEGDIVLLCPEYFLDHGDPRLQAQLVDINKGAYSYMDFSFFEQIRFWVQNIQRSLYALYQLAVKRPLVVQDFNRMSFNAEGDFIDHFDKLPKEKLGDYVKVKYFDASDNINRLNHFILEVRKNKVDVFLTHPSYCESGYKLNKDVIDRIDAQYRANLNCPVLGNTKTFVLPDSLFYDTVYHLTKEGRDIRTNVLEKLIVPHIRKL